MSSKVPLIDKNPLTNDLQQQQQSVQETSGIATAPNVFKRASEVVVATSINPPASPVIARKSEKGSWDKPNVFEVIVCNNIVLIVCAIEILLFFRVWYIPLFLTLCSLASVFTFKLCKHKAATILGLIAVLGAIVLPIVMFKLFGFAALNPFAK